MLRILFPVCLGRAETQRHAASISTQVTPLPFYKSNCSCFTCCLLDFEIYKKKEVGFMARTNCLEYAFKKYFIDYFYWKFKLVALLDLKSNLCYFVHLWSFFCLRASFCHLKRIHKESVCDESLHDKCSFFFIVWDLTVSS